MSVVRKISVPLKVQARFRYNINRFQQASGSHRRPHNIIIDSEIERILSPKGMSID